MRGPARRLNITLDPEHGARLARLAELAHVQEGTLARSLLATAIDEADPDTSNLLSLLDGIAGAYDRAQMGLQTGRAGKSVPLDDL